MAFRPIEGRAIFVAKLRQLSRYLCLLILYLLFPFAFRKDNWSVKGKRRKTMGTGRMRYLKIVRRRFKNGFREGNVPYAHISHSLPKY